MIPMGNGAISCKIGTNEILVIDKGGSIALFDGLAGELNSQINLPLASNS